MPSKDTRVVQMEFDNSKFDRNIRESQKTLDDFKEDLDFDDAINQMERFEKSSNSMKFDSLVDNIDKLASKFTGLGDIGEFAASKIRSAWEGALNKVIAFGKSISIDQMDPGMQKYEQLNKSVQTIMAATGREERDVYKVLERLNEYTDQTSYNFSDMAQNIGKFTSVGINLEDAERQMEGIANWAARSGAGINEASRAMYNLSQAMGVGKLTLIDWKSIENAGMATKEFKEQLIEAGVAAGTLTKEVDKKTGEIVYKTAASLGKVEEVTFQNVSSTLNKGWATSKVISATLEKYYWDDLYYDGFQAVMNLSEDGKKVFEDMLKDNTISLEDWNNLKKIDAITDDTKQKILDLGVESKQITKTISEDGRTIYTVLDKNGKEISFTIEEFENVLGSGWLNKGFIDTIDNMESLAKSSYESAQKCLTFTDVLGAWKDQVSTGWMTSYKILFGELSEAMEFFSAVCNKVGDSLYELIKFRNDFLSSWSDNGGKSTFFQTIIGDYDEDFQNGAFGLLDVIGGVKDLLVGAFTDLISSFAPESIRKNIKEDPEFLASYLGVKLGLVTKKIQDFMKSIRNFFTEIPTGQTESRFAQIQHIVQAVFSAVLLVWDILNGIKGFVIDVLAQLQPSFDAILGFFTFLSQTFSEAIVGEHEAGRVTGFFHGLAGEMTPLTSSINSLVTTITDLLKRFVQWGVESGAFKFIIEAFTTAINVLAKVINRVAGPIIGFVSDLFSIIGDLFKEGINEESMKKAGERLSEAFMTMLHGMFDGLGANGGLISQIKDFFKYIFGMTDEMSEAEAADAQKTFFGRLKILLRSIISGVKGFFGDLQDKAENGPSLFSILKGFLSLGNFNKYLRTFNSLIASGNLYKSLKAISTIVLLLKAIKFVKSAKNTTDEISGFIGGLGQSLKEGFKLKVSDETESFGDKMLKIAKAIALVAAAVVVLGNIPINVLTQGFIAILAIMGSMVLFVWAIKKVTEGNLKNAMSVIGSIVSIAAAIAIISVALSLLILALKPIGNMDWSQIAKMIFTFGALLTIMGGFVVIMNKLTEKKGLFGRTSSTGMKMDGINNMTKLAIAMGVLIFALKPLSKMNWEQLAKMGVGLIGLLGILLGFTFAMSRLEGGMKNNLKGVNKLSALAISIAILVFALKPLADMSWEQLGKIGAGLVVILGIILIFNLIMDKSKYGMTNMKGSSSLLPMAISILILVQALLPLASLKWGQLAKIGVGLGVMLLILNAYVQSVSEINSGKKALAANTSLLFMALGIRVLMKALMPLASISWGQMLKIGVGLAGVLIGIGTFLKFLDDIDPKAGLTAFLTLIPLALVMLTFGFAMGSLENVTWDKIVASMLGLSSVLITMGLILKYMMKNTVITDGITMLLAMVSLAVVMLVFSMAINEVKNVDTEKITGFAQGLAVMMIAMAASLKLLQQVNLGAALKGILIITIGLSAIVAAVMAVIALVGPWMLSSLGSALEPLSDGLTQLGTALGTISSSINGVNATNMSACIDLIKQIGLLQMELTASNISLAVFQSILGDKVKPADLKAFGTDMAALGESCAVFADAIAGKDFSNAEDAVKVIEFVGKLQSELTKQNISLAVFSFITGSDISAGNLENFGKGMAALAPGVGDFADAISGKDFGNVDSAVKAIEAIQKIQSQLTKQNIVLTVFSKLLDTDIEAGSLSKFGEDMTSLAPGIADFAKAIEGKDFSNIDNAIKAIEAVQKLQTQLTKDEIALAVFNKLTGLNIDKGNLQSFGKDMAKLGPFVADFANGVKNADFKNVDKASSAISAVLELQKSLTGQNISLAVFKALTGEDIEAGNIEAFGNSMKTLVPGLSAFAEGIKDANFDNVEAASSAITAVVELQKALGGQAIDFAIFKALTGKDVEVESLASFGANMALLAPGVSLFAAAVKDQDFTNVEGAAAAISAVTELQKALGDQAIDFAKFQFFTGVKVKPESLESFGSNMALLAPGVAAFGEAIKDTQFGDMDNAAKAIEAVQKLQTQLTKDGINFSLFKAILGDGMTVQSLEDFGNGMAALGPGVAKFADAIADSDFSNVEKAKEAITYLGSLQKSFTDNAITGAILTKFFGDDVKVEDLESFGTKISKLGEGLAMFANSVNFAKDETGEIDETKVTDFDNAIEAIKVLSDIQNKLPTLGGVISWFSGSKQDLKSFGDGIGELGAGLSAFNTNIKGANIDYDAEFVNNALGAVSYIADIIANLDGHFGNPYVLVEFFDTLNASIQNTESGKNFIQNFAEVMKSIQDSLAEAKVNMSEDNASALKDMLLGFSSLVEVLTTDELSNGLGDGAIKVKEDANLSYKLKTVGEWVSKGIGTGIEGSMNTVTGSISTLVAAAIQKFKDENGIESPSRVYAGLAKYIPLGIAKGIDSESGEVYNESGNMIDGMTRIFGDAVDDPAFLKFEGLMATISSAMANEVDAQPTIAPVLDLSNIDSGLTTMDQMLSAPRSLRLSGMEADPSRYGYSEGTYDQSTQALQSDLTSIRSQISELGSKISELGTNVGNMRIYLDSKVLVGGITNGVDSNLGRKNLYASRRN